MKRSTFIKSLGIIPLGLGAMKLSAFSKLTGDFKEQKRLPVLFVGHGSPMNVIADNSFTKHLNQLGKQLELPKAILVISAHWLTRGTKVSITPKPETIYDFGGFPDALYNIKYPAPGSPEHAAQLMQEVHKTGVEADAVMGLDHGAWTILHHIYPKADIPVFQMSIDYSKDAQYHFDLAAELSALRDKGILIIASGNVVHNLGRIDFNENAPVYDWAAEADKVIKTKIDQRLFNDLVNYNNLGTSVKMGVPTNDHYLPMIYALGLLDKNEQAKYTFEGFQNASISMRCFVSV